MLMRRRCPCIPSKRISQSTSSVSSIQARAALGTSLSERTLAATLRMIATTSSTFVLETCRSSYFELGSCFCDAICCSHSIQEMIVWKWFSIVCVKLVKKITNPEMFSLTQNPQPSLTHTHSRSPATHTRMKAHNGNDPSQLSQLPCP